MVVALLSDQAISDNLPLVRIRGSFYGRSIGMCKMVSTLWTAC